MNFKRKSILVFMVILALMFTIVGCGKTPKENLIGALNSGKTIDYSQPIKGAMEFKIDRLKIEATEEIGLTDEDKKALDLINQMVGDEVKVQFQSDMKNETVFVSLDGSLFSTPFQTEIYLTPDKAIIDIEKLKDLIKKIEEVSGEPTGIALDGMKKYIYTDDKQLIEDELGTAFEDFNSNLSMYNETSKISNQLAAEILGKMDESYFKKDGDYVVLSFNNESLKTLIDQILNEIESNPDQFVNDIFAMIERMYPSIENMAQANGEPVPSKEEFQAQMEQGKTEFLNQVKNKENMQMIRSSIDQFYSMFNGFVKINKYDVGYEIDDNMISGSKAAIDITVNKSYMIPMTFDLAVNVTSHFENGGEIKLPELTPDNSQNVNQLQ